MVFKFLKQLFGFSEKKSSDKNKQHVSRANRARIQLAEKEAENETRSRASKHRVSKQREFENKIRNTIILLKAGIPDLERATKKITSDNGPRKIIPELRGIKKNIVEIDNYYNNKYPGDLAVNEALGDSAPPFPFRDLKKEYEKWRNKYWVAMDKYWEKMEKCGK